MAPTLINSACEGDVHKGSPFGALRLFEKLHSGLVREAVPFARVARNAGADDILPSCLAATIAWKDMIDVQTRPIKECSAVLAGVLVPLENIQPRELDLFFRESIKEAEDDDSWHPDLERDGLEHSRLRIGE